MEKAAPATAPVVATAADGAGAADGVAAPLAPNP
eukprot:CAMPEP_0203825454 /NCGR_PEP_ID=MMETSP0115-20131106/54266_1 /ASSEMBLY_ACC=CAM_ASM_000227 /TAXON_ID=33651 /ORGANISM="Bicosoecid sp, Strain ms1" /LENGTH=33 /DNA_ID= /DNA_START= /DNA_END= /DNA_ORIENTATION=